MAPVIGLIGLGLTVKQSLAQKKAAKESRQAREKQVRLRERIGRAQARRQARIRRARVQAAAGAQGVAGATVEGAVAGIETSLSAGLDLLSSQTRLQEEQFRLQESSIRSAADAQIGQALGSVAADAFTSEPVQDFLTSGGVNTGETTG